MHRASRFVFLLVLLSCSSAQTLSQPTANQPQTSPETKTEAARLLQEGIDLTGAGQLPEAIRALEQAIKLDPQYAEAYAALGRAYFKMREWRRAADNLHYAAALNAQQRQAKITAPPSAVAPATQPLQPEPSAPTREPEKQTSGATGVVQPSNVQTARYDPDVKNLTRARRSISPVLKPIALATESVPLDVTPNEKKTAELLKPEVVEPPEEAKPEPTVADVSTSAPTTASPVESKAASPIPLEPSSEDVSLTKIYRVGPGDVLDVRINGAQQQQSTLFTITPAGLLEHPLLAEPLNVSALTTEEIETKIQDDLKKRAVIENPETSVAVRDYASHSILVSGLAKDSGTRFLRREAIPLYVVVADAQPLPEAAKVTIVRNELNQVFEIDLTKFEEMSLLVRPGDVINLQRNETEFIYVGGEVKAPGEIVFRPGLTLTQAIISAGGMTRKAKVAEIGRDDGRGFLIKTTFKLGDIQTGTAKDPAIKPGDRIVIRR
jgi:protein involved in polysaccharide export with SLBB domain